MAPSSRFGSHASRRKAVSLSKRAGLIFPASSTKSFIKASTPSLSIGNFPSVAVTAVTQVLTEHLLGKLSLCARMEKIAPGAEPVISDGTVEKFLLNTRLSGPYRRFFRGVINFNPRCVRPGDDDLLKKKEEASDNNGKKKKDKKKKSSKAESA